MPFLVGHPSASLVEGIGTPKLGQVVEFDAWPRSLEELATKLGRTARP